jgi:hypothetical protein
MQQRTVRWHPLIRHESMTPPGENIGGHTFGRYYILDKGQKLLGELAYYVDKGYTRPGETVRPIIHVRWVFVDLSVRRIGVGLSLAERLCGDYPEHQVDPGNGHADAVAWSKDLTELIPGLKARMIAMKVWSDEDRDKWGGQ